MLTYIFIGLFQGLFWLIALSVALWIVRRFFSSWETALFKVGATEGIRMVIRRALARMKPLKPEPPVPSAPSQAVSVPDESRP
jgi:hypothetical protein